MFDSIQIGMSGMEGFSKGLKVISNNVANLNTPGFKSSTMQFTDAYYQQDAAASNNGGTSTFGTGLTAQSSVIDFHAGESQQTGNPLDVSINGDGYLVTTDKDGGGRTYTRDGQLQFDKDGHLVSTTTGHYILGYADGNALVPITLDGLRISPAKATTTVKFKDNVNTAQDTSGAVADTNIESVVVNDATGASHTLKLNLKSLKSGQPDEWAVTVMEGDTTVATGQISFIAGSANPGEETVSFKYSPKGAAPFDLKFDFSAATGYDTGSSTGSTGGMNPLAVASQDGYDAGAITSMTFDEDGHLSLSYANGQTTKGPQLALARFESTQSLAQQGHGEFTAADASSARMGRANDAGMGKIEAGRIEMSNVDLSGEFSNLIVMQRGYQASSTVVSTANDMLQQLFQMHGNR